MLSPEQGQVTPPSVLPDPRVLIIDDQAEVREYTTSVLNALGVTRVVAVGSGEEALAAVTEQGVRFDLIFCDLQMAGGDGVETLHALADLGIDAAFVVMSVEDRRIIESVGLIAKAQGLLLLGAVQKPIDLATMQTLLGRLNDERPEPESVPVTVRSQEVRDAFRLDEFHLVYQPKVQVRTRRFVGVEALVRWQHPTLGLILPNNFVPLIERSSDFTGMLSEFALRHAIACAGRWRRAGGDLRVAINLSASALAEADLPERIAEIAREAAVPNECITLEVTETQVARDVIRMAQVASRLRLKRFNLSIDDFGTGQSGLSQLRQLPFNEIKIDRQFVHGCSRSATQRSVVEASLALARNLELTTVAEGVEERADWHVLVALGCDVIQGYHVARPMSEAGLAEWIRQWNSRTLR